jgi:predicted acetyltransferase
MMTVAIERQTEHGLWTLRSLEESERALLERLAQFYSYDFSEVDGDNVDDAGLYHGYDLTNYGREPGNQAWIARVDGKPAGFALIDLTSTFPGKAHMHALEDFHVMRAYRRRGLGEWMAVSLFDQFPGRWLVGQIAPNVAAQQFWRRLIGRYTGGRFSETTFSGQQFDVFFQEFETADKVGQQ